MKKIILVRFIFFVLLFTIFMSCGITKSVPSAHKEVSSDTLSDDKLLEFKYQFFEANKYFLASNYEMAISIFQSCLKIDPTSSAVHYKLASIYLLNKDYKLAEYHAERSVFYNNSNIWYLYLAGSIYSQNNNISKAKETFEALIAINGNEIDYYLNLADVYLKDNDLKGALKLYNTIEEKFGISEIISLQKHKLYMATNNKKEALQVLIDLSASNPESVEYKRMIADFYVQNNNIEEAINAYNLILLGFPNDGFCYIGLAECYRKKGDIDKSFEQIKLAFMADNVQSEVKFNLLLSIVQSAGDDLKIQNSAYELSEILIKMYPNDADINTIYANFLLQKGVLVKAREVLINVVSLRKDKYSIWEQLILLDNQFQDWDTMFIHTTEALQYFPNQSFLYFFNGFSAFQLKNYLQAIKSLEFGYKLITKDDPLVPDYLSIIGESYYKLGNKEQAYKQFDTILDINKENIMVLNNYAYYLSLDNINLEKAEKMSKITIEREPNNPTYLDTYAWVLFKLKRYNEALIYIERAVKNDTSISDVVLEHYGDILFNTGNVSEALFQWNKAKELGDGSGFLKEKIEKKMYFEK